MAEDEPNNPDFLASQPELVARDSVAELSQLVNRQEELIDTLQKRAHALSKAAFEWKKAQGLTGLRLEKQWESYPGGPKKYDHTLYYYLVNLESGEQILFEIFKPYLLDSSRSRTKPDYLCVVEYTAGVENPLEFDRDAVVGATMFARHGYGDLVQENFKEALGKEALAITSYARRYPIFDDRGEHRINAGGASFGWSIQQSSTQESLTTYIGGRTIPGFYHETLSYRGSRGSDPLDDAQRRLDLLARAELVGISEPPEYQITLFSKTA